MGPPFVMLCRLVLSLLGTFGSHFIRPQSNFISTSRFPRPTIQLLIASIWATVHPFVLSTAQNIERHEEPLGEIYLPSLVHLTFSLSHRPTDLNKSKLEDWNVLTILHWPPNARILGTPHARLIRTLNRLHFVYRLSGLSLLSSTHLCKRSSFQKPSTYCCLNKHPCASQQFLTIEEIVPLPPTQCLLHPRPSPVYTSGDQSILVGYVSDVQPHLTSKPGSDFP